MGSSVFDRAVSTGGGGSPAILSGNSLIDNVSTEDLYVVMGSIDSTVDSTMSSMISSDGCTLQQGNNNCVMVGAEGNFIPENSGQYIGMYSSIRSVASANFATMLGSSNSSVLGVMSSVIGSISCTVSGSSSVIIGSSSTENAITNSLAIGTGTGSASTANRTIHLYGSSGDIELAGSMNSSATFSDFGEMLPNGVYSEIAPGTILTLNNGKVVPADEGDDICGVVSHTMVIRAGDSPFCWQGRYLTDEWGRFLYDEIPDPNWAPEKEFTHVFDETQETFVSVPNPKYDPNETANIIKVKRENPQWDDSQEQLPRSERPNEWTPVGMLGQVYVRTGEQVSPNDRIKAISGLGFKSTEKTGLKVIKVTKNYDGDYGIAFCLINITV